VPIVVDATATLLSMNMDDGIGSDPVCMFLISDIAMNATCLGCVGSKGIGSYQGPWYWKDLKGRCASCTRPIAGSEGVFCASVSSKQGS
jgi:hypothetical protein